MAVTLAVVKRNVVGAQNVVTFDCTGPASYTTGGETLTAAQYGQLLGASPPAAAAFSSVQFFESERDTVGRQLVLDKANNKMMYFAAGAEVASTTNLSAVVIRGRAYFGQVTG